MNSTIVKAAIGTSGAVSGFLSYDGLTSQLGNHDFWHASMAAATATAVFMALIAFWAMGMETVPQIKSAKLRRMAWGLIGVGCLFLMGMSSYWNTLALSDNQLQELILKDIASQAESTLNEQLYATSNFAALQGQVDSLHRTVQNMKRSEGRGTGTTGAQGAGPVYSLLEQVEGKVDAVLSSLDAATQKRDDIAGEARQCMTDLRDAISVPNSGSEVTRHVACINDSIAALNSLSFADQISVAMDGLVSGIVIPGGITSDRQREAVRRILDGIGQQALAISAAASEVPRPAPLFVSNDRPNSAEALLKFWHKLIPSLTTATCIDLLPVILLSFWSLHLRDAERRKRPTGNLSVSQLLDALEHLEFLNNSGRSGARRIRSRKTGK